MLDRVTFPDGIYYPIEDYAEVFDKPLSTVKREAQRGTLKRRNLKGKWYVKAYNK
tara:strand:+ start:183 stop:347 length:165 start_codon:yes stop_codon:yes gene_type:complete